MKSNNNKRLGQRWRPGPDDHNLRLMLKWRRRGRSEWRAPGALLSAPARHQHGLNVNNNTGTSIQYWNLRGTALVNRVNHPADWTTKWILIHSVMSDVEGHASTHDGFQFTPFFFSSILLTSLTAFELWIYILLIYISDCKSKMWLTTQHQWQSNIELVVMAPVLIALRAKERNEPHRNPFSVHNCKWGHNNISLHLTTHKYPTSHPSPSKSQGDGACHPTDALHQDQCSTCTNPHFYYEN